MHFEAPAIIIANHSSTESAECGKEKKHIVEKRLSLITRSSYSVATHITSSLCCVHKTPLYDYEQENYKLVVKICP
jgi:hypothetical protein